MPARAVETGQEAFASASSIHAADWRSTSTTSRRDGKPAGAPRRSSARRASSKARAPEFESKRSVTAALCHSPTLGTGPKLPFLVLEADRVWRLAGGAEGRRRVKQGRHVRGCRRLRDVNPARIAAVAA